MNHLAVFVTGDSPRPDAVHIGATSAKVVFPGQKKKRDDHLVMQAARDALPIHVFWRATGGAEFMYLGVSHTTTIWDDGSGPDPMLVSVETEYQAAVPCGKLCSATFGWKYGALAAAGFGPEDVQCAASMHTGFVPLN